MEICCVRQFRDRPIFVLLSLIIPAIIVLVSLQEVCTVTVIIIFIDFIVLIFIFTFFFLRIILFFGDSLCAVSPRLDTGFGTIRLESSMLPGICGGALDVSEQWERRLAVGDAVPCFRMMPVAEGEVALMVLELERESGDR